MAYPTRVRYGLRLLVRIAIQGDNKRISMNEIAVEEQISLKYLEQIVSSIKAAGILRSMRGPGGGYVLAMAPGEITLEEIFSCLGGLAPMVPCLDKKSQCVRCLTCQTRAFWALFDNNSRMFLRSLTLADLLHKQSGDDDIFPEFGAL